MNRKVVIPIVAFIAGALVLITSYVLRSASVNYNNLTGNDINSIKKIIGKDKIISNPFSIIDVIDVDELRIVGFIEAGKNLGIATFKKDEKENYIYSSIDINGSADIASFFIPNQKIPAGTIKHIVLSNTPEVEKVKLVGNDKYIDEKETKGTYPTMLLLEINVKEPQVNSQIYYYDKLGNLVK